MQELRDQNIDSIENTNPLYQQATKLMIECEQVLSKQSLLLELISGLVNSGDRLDDLVSKTEELPQQAYQFRKY